MDSDLGRALFAITPSLFLDFLRNNTELLDAQGTINWVLDRQKNYPEDALKKFLEET